MTDGFSFVSLSKSVDEIVVKLMMLIVVCLYNSDQIDFLIRD